MIAKAKNVSMESIIVSKQWFLDSTHAHTETTSQRFRLPLDQVKDRQFSACLITEDRKSVIFTGIVSFLAMVLSWSKTDDRSKIVSVESIKVSK